MPEAFLALAKAPPKTLDSPDVPVSMLRTSCGDGCGDPRTVYTTARGEPRRGDARLGRRRGRSGSPSPHADTGTPSNLSSASTPTLHTLSWRKERARWPHDATP
jgi:hypothetical protein